MRNLECIFKKLPAGIGDSIRALPYEITDHLEEIRIRTGSGIRIISGGREFAIDGITVDYDMMNRILNSLLNHSYYAYEEELSKGYITIEGGHRVGICGKTVLDRGRVNIIKDISSVNIRCSREIIGIAEPLKDIVTDRNVLIASPPGCGKTTLLRDITRLLSCSGRQVSVCDERSEIAGTYMGKSTYDLGPRTDILDGCPKAEGMMMLIRSMGPDVIITDEIGREEDACAIEAAVCAGINIIASIHGGTYEEAATSRIGSMIRNGIFSRLIFLTNIPHTGTVREVMSLD